MLQVSPVSLGTLWFSALRYLQGSSCPMPVLYILRETHYWIWFFTARPHPFPFFPFSGIFHVPVSLSSELRGMKSMVLINLVLPNSTNISVKQEQIFCIIIACYITDFLFLLINPWLLWLCDLQHFYPCLTFVLISIRKVWDTEPRQGEQFKSQERSCPGIWRGWAGRRGCLGGGDASNWEQHLAVPAGGLCHSCSHREENNYYSQWNILLDVAHAVLNGKP